MALTDKELKLALKGYPVINGKGHHSFVQKIKDRYGNDMLLSYLNGHSDIYNLNGEKDQYRHELYLDHEEARRIGFVPQPEFGDQIDVFNGHFWHQACFINMGVDNCPICVRPIDIGYYDSGQPYETEIYTNWRWPKNSPYNLTKYRVFKNDEEIELSGEQEEKVKEVVESKPEEHKNKRPKEGEYWWLSGLDTSGYWKLGRIKSLPSSDKDTANVSRYMNGYWSSSAVSISKFFERKMTLGEIEEQLSRIAKKLGYCKGTTIRDIYKKNKHTLERLIITVYDYVDDALVYCGHKNTKIIYREGQWAEIIPPSELDKNIAVECDAEWKKEKVAKIWEIDFGDIDMKEDVFVYKYYNKLNGAKIRGIGESLGFSFESFEQFCQRHGKEPRPDYVKDAGGVVCKVCKWRLKNLFNTSEQYYPYYARCSYIEDWQPATKKEFDNQNKK